MNIDRILVCKLDLIYLQYFVDLSSCKGEGEFCIALAVLEHCRTDPVPAIFSFKEQKTKGIDFSIEFEFFSALSVQRKFLQNFITYHKCIFHYYILPSDMLRSLL